MWEGILTNISSSFFGSLCIRYVNQKRRKAFENKLSGTVGEQFRRFADTSLDCDAFARVVQSSSFREALQQFFYAMDDGAGRQLYVSAFVDDVCQRCPGVDRREVTDFVGAIETVYTSYLRAEIDNDPELSALYRLLMQSQKALLKSILSSQEKTKEYFAMLHERTTALCEQDIRQYHEVCAREYGTIRFTGISGIESKAGQNINDFYVENTFTLVVPAGARIYKPDAGEDAEGASLRLSELFAGNNKVVLIGGAGLGKSTSLNYLFCNYERLYGSQALKLKIDLREYASDISMQHRDIVWCLATEFSRHISRGKRTIDDIRGLLSEKLERGKCLVIFDALDEIPTQESRNRVRDAISTFCAIYCLNRFIISSREVGYLKNCFDDQFIHIRINEFDDDQIRAYSRNWLRVNHGDADFEAFWARFRQEVDRARCQKLIGNPIILILALVIFDIQNSLPNRRVEFYKKCIDTFLVSREDRKGMVDQSDSFKNILGDSSIVPKVAHYKFEKISEDMSYRFTLDELKRAIMLAIEVSNERQWIDPVARYAKYLIDRTELIREIDENNYDFAHKTFYEYFLATYYAQQYSAEELISLLDRWIGDANNDELARLVIEVVVEKNDAAQHRAIIHYLVRRADDPAHAESALAILIELYNHNALQAKFHDLYFTCRLRHSRAAQHVEFMQSRFVDRRRRERASYDEQRMAELFVQSADQGPECLYEVVEAIHDLNDAFRKRLTEQSGRTLYRRLVELFEHTSGKRQIRSEDSDSLCRYFLDEQLDLVLHAPAVYLAVAQLAVDQDAERQRRLFDQRFEVNELFTHYVGPPALKQLIDAAMTSGEDMLLFLIMIVHCAAGSTGFLFMYMMNEYRFMGKGKGQLLTDRLRPIWENLFQDHDPARWERWLRQQGLYLEPYGALYRQLCKEYAEAEQGERETRRSVTRRLREPAPADQPRT